MQHRPFRAIAIVAALGLLGAACSDDDDATPSTDPTPTSDTGAEAPDSSDSTADGPSEVEADDIVDTAVAAGDFTTLVAAVQAAGLEETLRGDGPFTVFAPTDDAFDALPEGTVETLLEDPSGDLTDILTYHVVSGAVMAADVVEMDGQEVETVNGATFTVGVGDDGTVTLTDGTGNEVEVVTVDVEAGNGVIHVIDGVLMPG